MNGFIDPISFRPFRPKAKEVHLYLYRERWKKNGDLRGGEDFSKSYHNVYNYAAERTEATRELGALFKSIA